MSRRFTLSSLCLALLLAACGGGTDTNHAPSTRLRQANAASIAPASAHYAPVLQRIYIGYFGRPADPEGLAWWADRLRDIEGPSEVSDMLAAYDRNPHFKALIDSFANSAEYQALYSGDNAGFVDAIYANMFGRTPDAEGRAFWIQALDNKAITRANAMLSIQAAARGDDKTLLVLKELMAMSFTGALNTPERIKAYSGEAAFYQARAMLTQAFPLGNMQIFQNSIDKTVAAMEFAYLQGQQPHQEVASGDRRIALMASAAQVTANGERLAQLATVLASDLSARDPGLGPKWQVDVLTAASSAKQIQQQLLGYSGTILIGDVPLPTHPGYGGSPAMGKTLDAYRIPACPLFRYDASGNTLLAPPELYDSHPSCRNGQTVALLHGRTAASDIAEVAAKLDQMIAYHRSSANANSLWTRTYRFINAFWGGGLEWLEVDSIWANTPLYTAAQYSYLNSGTGAERMQAFQSCLGSNAEMCVFNGHGSPQLIMAEGPGVVGEQYSKDFVNLTSADIKPQSVKAKYVSLVSCSTQDLWVQDNLGANLLMSGRALLTHGMKSVSLITDRYERVTIQEGYAALAAGATFAEAFGDRELGTPSVMQGDPFITQRPMPSGEWPKLAIDGKRYHGGVAVVPIHFPDSIARATVYKTIVLTNKGKVELRVRAASGISSVGPDVASQDGVTPKQNGVMMQFDAPVRIAPNADHFNFLSDVFVLQPGQSMPITYSLTPWDIPGVPLQVGGFQGKTMLITNDPAAPQIVLELHGNVKAAP